MRFLSLMAGLLLAAALPACAQQPLPAAVNTDPAPAARPGRAPDR
ncbi:MAG: peptidoglycan-associated lipoprotein, partial [Oxalobacteraceae bacterium]